MRSDEALLQAVREGELRAFDVLYRRYERRLFGYVLRLVGERALAEDLFQEILLRALADAPADLRPGGFAGWLFTVARNECLGHLRQAGRREALLDGAAREPSRTLPGVPPRSEAGGEPRAHQAVVVRDALEQLPEAQREVLLLKEVAGLSYREIAAVQSVPEGTAKSRLHFAIAALRRVFGT